jgi:hypothetical protein
VVVVACQTKRTLFLSVALDPNSQPSSHNYYHHQDLTLSTFVHTNLYSLHTVYSVQIVLSAFNGMLKDEMEFRSVDVEGDSTVSRGQATLRRLMRGNHISDRTLTPATGDEIDPRLGSVFAPGVSSVRSIRFSELTAAETTSLPFHFSDNGESRRTPEDWGPREILGRNDRIEYPIIHEDLGTRSSEQYGENVDSKEDQQQE